MSIRATPIILLLLLCLPGLAAAETAYVMDKAGLRALPNKETLPLKTISSGAAVEVLERVPNFVRVRDADGAEGWIEMSLLAATESPATGQGENQKALIANLNGHLAKARASLAQEIAKNADLTRKLAEKTAQIEKDTLENTQSAATAQPTATSIDTAPPLASQEKKDDSWSLGWLAFSFAMLILGFFAGVIWLREVNRKKLGGMYLRI